ncbi:hypothetical protein [Nitratireductor alexandrii]|uniref:hypothetical protein n=1 Tax=Nitratireductor alexandrii TaxID=2448161 RepID=UPI0013DF4ACD|nr:hypothetical protein [Nitratireductor alexandrii]
MPTPLDPENARQGRRGLRVLIVLIVALILASVAWVGVEWWGEAYDADTGARVEHVG